MRVDVLDPEKTVASGRFEMRVFMGQHVGPRTRKPLFKARWLYDLVLLQTDLTCGPST